MKKKISKKQIGIGLVVIGVGLVYWGYRMASSLGGKLSSTFSGSPGDQPMMLYIAGAVCLALGVYQLIK